MKYLNKKFLIVLAVLTATVAFTGCKKSYLDINSDPNRVTDDNVTPELIFPRAAVATGGREGGNPFFINDWMGYFAASGSFAIDQTSTSYNIDFNYGDATWQNQYDVLFDLHQTKVKALAKGDSVLAGATMILSARLFQDLVDVFGDIPYTQAFDNDHFSQPVYDKAVDVYGALQKSLDTAVIFMNRTKKSTFNAVDVVNGGNQTKWIKFANTLKLRLLIRQSQVSGFSPSAEIAKIIANGGVLHAGETVSVNPGFSNDNNKQSPFYANFGSTPTGNDASPPTRANTYFIQLLNSTADPRVSRYYKVPDAGGVITGCVFGAGTGNPDGNHSSRMGPGLAGSATQPQWIFTSFESMFLEAEAIARGWMPGVAQTAYQNAVTESFTWLGVPNAAAAATMYMLNAPIANWTTNAGATPASQSKFIAYQKYIALCGTDPIEAWSDLRRLNMIPDAGYLSVNRSSNPLPIRLLYPQSEYTTNGTNVGSEGSINQFTSKIFWQP
jgi:Starch-binding associating with outer membrane